MSGATRALYHEGTALTFSSAVVALDGTRCALAGTAFYPEGGGQAADVGELSWPGGQARVSDTRKDKETGLIWHTLEAVVGELPLPGAAVQGRVEAGTRWRHMQRHSAEHLLAQAFLRVNPAFTVASVNMTGPQCTLDFHGHPGEADVQAAEQLLRQTLGRTDLTLETPVVPEAELALYPLRRESKVRGQVRLVIFRDGDGQPFDVSACGGTHVPRASLCAPVVVLRTERIKGGQTRVVFMAGEEAGAYLAGVYRESRALAQGFSVPVEHLPERVAALEADLRAQGAEVERLRAVLARQLIQGTEAEQLNGLPTYLMRVPDDALLVPVLSSVPPGAVVVAVSPAGRCGVGSGHSACHAGEVLRQALALTGGKGGGRAELAQGTTADPAGFLQAVHTVISSTNA